jgi:predicted nucleic acid-binding Zn ribbon protein
MNIEGLKHMKKILSRERKRKRGERWLWLVLLSLRKQILEGLKKLKN